MFRMHIVLQTALALRFVAFARGFTPIGPSSVARQRIVTTLSMSTSASALPSWTDLKSKVTQTNVGSAIDQEVDLRKEGKGSAHGKKPIATYLVILMSPFPFQFYSIPA